MRVASVARNKGGGYGALTLPQFPKKQVIISGRWEFDPKADEELSWSQTGRSTEGRPPARPSFAFSISQCPLNPLWSCPGFRRHDIQDI